MSEYLHRTLAVLMAIAMLASCSLPTSGPGRPGEAALLSAAAKAMSVDGVIEEVGKALSSEYGDDPAWQDTLAELSSSSAYGVAEKALGEGSQEYLEFCIAASEAESVDSILEAASGLAPESELDKVRDAVSDLEAEAKLIFASDTKILTPEQEEDFYDDLTNLVITSAVLLTAAIVYWAVPDVILWGKITAAAAVAVEDADEEEPPSFFEHPVRAIRTIRSNAAILVTFFIRPSSLDQPSFFLYSSIPHGIPFEKLSDLIGMIAMHDDLVVRERMREIALHIIDLQPYLGTAEIALIGIAREISPLDKICPHILPALEERVCPIGELSLHGNADTALEMGCQRILPYH